MPPHSQSQSQSTRNVRKRTDGVKPTWKPDRSAKACSGCRSKFTLTLRRHHCRRCGNIFCKNCAAERKLMGKRYGYGHAPQRQCLLCICLDEQLLELQLEESEARRILADTYVWSWQTETTILLGFTLLSINKDSRTGSGNVPDTVQLCEPSTPSSSASPRTAVDNGEASSPMSPSNISAVYAADKELFVDPALVRAAVGFVDVVCSPLTSLRRDRRLNLKLQRQIFSHPEVASWFSCNVPSVAVDVFWDILKRGGLFDHVAEKCYRFNDLTVLECREAVEKDDAAVQIGSSVVERGSNGVAEMVVTSIDEGEAVLLKQNGDVIRKEFNEIEISPFAGVTAALPKLLCGRVKDLDGEPIDLCDVKSELVRIALIFTKHVTTNLLTGPDTVFTGKPVIEWLTASWDLSQTDATDLCEVLHRIGVIEPYPKPPSAIVFDGTEEQSFRPTHSIVKSLEDTLDCVKPMTSGTVQSNVTGNTVIVTQPGRNRYREGHVVEGLGNRKIKVQFSNGDVWVFDENELVSSPAVEVLEMAKDDKVGLADPAVCNLSRMFTSGMQRHIKKIQWQGVTRYTNAFNSDDAITWMTKSFPSLSATNAVDVLELLRKVGLFSHGAESELTAAFKKNSYYKFQPGAMKLLDQHVIEAKGQDTDVSRILHETLVKGTVRRHGNKARERRQSQPPGNSSWGAASPQSHALRSLTRKRPGSLPATSLDGLTDVVKEGYLSKKVESGRWALQRYVLMGGGELERHAPRARVVTGTRLRKLPKDDGKGVWADPPINVEVDELLTVIAPPTGGYLKIKREGVEGYIRSFNMTPLPALHSTMQTREVEVRASEKELPGDKTWPCGMVIRDGRNIHYLAAQNDGDRERWLDVLRET